MATSVKICGLKDAAAVQSVVESGAEFAGFVFYPASPRHLTLQNARTLKDLLPKTTQSVSVLVNPDDTLLNDVFSILSPDWIQLHGAEPPERLRQLRQRYPSIRIIKALSVREACDLEQAASYRNVADIVMFDAKAPASSLLPGGNGLSFDWALLSGRSLPAQWMLSGGLTHENVAQAVHLTGAPMVDVSSGVERQPGVKDAALIHAFVKAVRHA